MVSTENVIGVIGGLGNEAMVDLAKKIQSVPGYAQNYYVFYGNSRLAYKPHEVGQPWKPEDEPELRKKATAEHSARIMYFLGCGTVGLACNSAHELFREVMPALPLTFVDMIYETAQSLSGIGTKVLVLGVDSLVNSGLYHRALNQYGVQAVSPSAQNMVKVMSSIYDTGFGIKTAKITPEAEKMLCEVITDECERQGCRAVVLGCTELPLALTAESCACFKRDSLIPHDVKIVDASAVLAGSLVESACAGRLPESDLDFSPTVNTDWFPPAVFILDTLEELVEVQSEIIRLTVKHLDEKGTRLKGSYMHLPTLFAVGNPPGFFSRAKALSGYVSGMHENWRCSLADILEENFSSMSGCFSM
ncbi:aspartate/glutamate racemase family protein [Maridesulfovibrio sp.]|uniref:aspartate/glutamate racemase family protein n=1 Tax=Maridesulfovibrio sp. TaxID=2795000 RepID=UPI0039EFDFE5